MEEIYSETGGKDTRLIIPLRISKARRNRLGGVDTREGSSEIIVHANPCRATCTIIATWSAQNHPTTYCSKSQRVRTTGGSSDKAAWRKRERKKGDQEAKRMQTDRRQLLVIAADLKGHPQGVVCSESREYADMTLAQAILAWASRNWMDTGSRSWPCTGSLGSSNSPSSTHHWQSSVEHMSGRPVIWWPVHWKKQTSPPCARKLWWHTGQVAHTQTYIHHAPNNKQHAGATCTAAGTFLQLSIHGRGGCTGM